MIEGLALISICGIFRPKIGASHFVRWSQNDFSHFSSFWAEERKMKGKKQKIIFLLKRWSGTLEKWY